MLKFTTNHQLIHSTSRKQFWVKSVLGRPTTNVYRKVERLPGDPASAWGRRKSSGKSEVSAGTGLLGKVEKMCIIDATLRKGLRKEQSLFNNCQS